MKKISTVGAKQIRNCRERKLTIGLDLGDRSSWYCVLDEAGEVLLEQRLGTTPKAMKEVFGKMPHSRIALETGMHSPWVSRVLSELGHEVIVAHARNVRLIGESRRKDDRFDARTLARWARIDPQLLAPVQHRSAQAQSHLIVIRARAGLVRARTVRRLGRIGSFPSPRGRVLSLRSRHYFFLACWPETWALEIEPSPLCVVWWQVKVQVLLPRL